ncbi:SDR family NAD(P)-dependent oxidoreductase [candidate division WWE3 bacterium]|nr:SDR family NAD(P)-dependent oxidoreductase [candidate division WWE3 bacterium]
MTYLITGGCGFIGTNFAEQLLKRGEKVILTDNLSRRGTPSNLTYLQEKYPLVEFVHADLRNDLETLQQLVEKVDVVYHLAGQVAVTTSVVKPREDFEINILGTFNILEAIRESEKRPMIIYSSTNKVYGGMEDIIVEETENRYQYKDLPLGIPENRLLDFHSPYGCSKGAADQYIRDYSRIYNIKSVVMRQSCIYGERQFGIEDQGWVAWFTIASVLGKSITIYGNGKQVRDVLHVEDLFNAWDIATKNIDTVSGTIYNVGGGPEHTMSLLELIDYIENLIGHKLTYTFSDWRPGDQPVYVSDITKAETELNWKPKITPRQGVEQLYYWVTENKHLFDFLK